ncbi:transporter substrate-binding domain-containing protein [uncultured Roseobacter sp.]|uniref:transporter substrate-binding domain-containing protein n=1 Tax=uncultured Roseobacter sp. TaxID=114847 RepID=UPI00262533E1|nr:transporter substrate-binding domain-containing protein [uncultured Roseobacter sp.]
MHEAREMKVAYLIEPPFNFRDGAGRITGCDIELARRVFHVLDVGEVTFVETEFADLLPGLQRGAWQMTTGLFATDARERHALFSRPIWALPDGLLMRAAESHRITGYRSLALDRTLGLAVIRDQAQHQTALRIGVLPEQITVFETYGEAAQAVREGGVSAYASVARAHQGYLDRSPGGDMQVAVVPATETPAGFGCFGIARTEPGLRDAVDGALETIIGSAAHRRMMRGFGVSDDEIDLLL